MVRDAAGLDAALLALGQHRFQHLALDLQRDVQVEVVLGLELERHAGHFEEGEEGAVVHLEEGVKRAAIRACRSGVYLERADQWEAEKIFIEYEGGRASAQRDAKFWSKWGAD